jgi:hypothetical protein
MKRLKNYTTYERNIAEDEDLTVERVLNFSIDGLTHAQFSEEIVPWRARTRDAIIDTLADMINIPISAMHLLANTELNYDSIAQWHRIEHNTAIGFLENL